MGKNSSKRKKIIEEKNKWGSNILITIIFFIVIICIYKLKSKIIERSKSIMLPDDRFNSVSYYT